MYSYLKPIGFAEKLVQKYESLATRDLFLLRFVFFFVPILVIFILQMLEVNFGIKFVIISLMISIMGLLYAFYVFIWIMKRDPGTDEMKEIAECILEGSDGFFKQQYGAIFKLSIVFAILIMILYWTKDPQVLGENSPTEFKQIIIISPTAQALFSGLSFILGALCSAFSGYAGMWVSVRANVRVTSAARKCYNEAIQIAFGGGYFGALINICLAIGGISILFLILSLYFSFQVSSLISIVTFFDKIPLLIISFGFGASFVAMFAQLGGGIYTKAADVGADLIGKVEAGIPEDDPRNPAVIADLVGDNVGDCAGQAADLFESISAEILSAMILGSNLATQAQFNEQTKMSFMLFPLALHCLDILSSTIGMLFVKTKSGLPEFSPTYGELEDALDVMKRGYRVAMAVGIPGFIALSYLLLEVNGSWIYFAACGLIGVNLAFLFIELTQYYTDYHYGPVKRIVFASKSGPATNIIAGLAVGMESTGLPVIAIAASVLGSYYLGDASGIVDPLTKEKIGGLYGTAIATMGMFCTGVYILSMSGYGPISDNAGGIAEMSHQPENVRNITDRLDAIGNVTKANAKGYSVGSASLACFLLFSAFIDEVNFVNGSQDFGVIDIMKPEIYIGGLLGAASVFMFSSLAIAAVGNAAQDIITEVRRQFRENPGILANTCKPNYKHCVEIVAKAGLREMIKPGLLATLSPIVCGLLFRAIGNLQNNPLLGAQAVCAFLMFSTATGILMALFLNNGGGAWDNAKKYIETGRVGGKGSDMHKAAVVGDTVGDPCKDTAGPSIHILIKLLSTITLVLTPIFIGK